MRVKVLLLAATMMFSIFNRSAAQIAPGDFSGQPTFGTVIKPVYQYCQVDAPGQPRVVTQGVCDNGQLSQGGVNFTSNYDTVTQTSPSVTQSEFPANGASQGVGVLVSGPYQDPRFPTAAYSVATTTLPLSDFATASSVASMNASLGGETNRAVAAEAVLGQAITTETNRARAAETVLGQAIVTESNAREADVARLSSQFKVATATAVALSGNGFIPGKRLNLTINYGSYEGKSAMAFQGAFVVNENAYLNLGVASGLSGGGTAFRTGLTMGW
ncbi:YadA-like C-terminal region [Caulobacter sp. UNC279MFTsu5.1]|nr:YadA-like C-terminal region [Caulobacter sp. UNC279MFTsu5.1]